MKKKVWNGIEILLWTFIAGGSLGRELGDYVVGFLVVIVMVNVQLAIIRFIDQ